MNAIRTVLLGLLLATAAGCLRVKTDPVEIKPIHIVVDVNVKVEKELVDFFSSLDAQNPTMKIGQ